MNNILLNRLEALEDKITINGLITNELMDVINNAYQSKRYSYAINTINKLLDEKELKNNI